MEEKKKNVYFKNVLIGVLLFLLGLSLFYIGYDKFFKENKKEDVNTENKNEKPNTENNHEDTNTDIENENEDATNTENVLKVYGKDGNICKERRRDCNDVVATLNVNNKDASILYINNKAGYILYLDDKIKMYDLQTKNIKELDISLPKDINSENTSLFLNQSYSENGFIYRYSDYKNEEKEEYYYDLENDKKLFSGYNWLYIVDRDGRYVAGTKNGTYYLLDTKTGQEVISRKPKEYESVNFNVHYGCLEQVIFSSYLQELVSQPYGYIIYNQDGTIRKELADDETMVVDNCQNGNDIYIYKKTKTYTFDGKEVK